jgi:hypothetical protein
MRFHNITDLEGYGPLRTLKYRGIRIAPGKSLPLPTGIPKSLQKSLADPRVGGAVVSRGDELPEPFALLRRARTEADKQLSWNLEKMRQDRTRNS